VQLVAQRAVKWVGSKAALKVAYSVGRLAARTAAR
jgi:hypothetical protein